VGVVDAQWRRHRRAAVTGKNGRPMAPSESRAPDRRASTFALACMALVAYVPLLLTNPGRVGGDTKAYLTIDPSQWLSKVEWLWSPAIGAGGVTHQNIGYLWPMGPWFWMFDRLGVPMWVAQRLWLGTIMFAAGAGTWWLCRRFLDRRIAIVAGFFYMLSPYVLQYSERMSVMLLPWAGLPWLIGLTAMARLQRSWKAPALFALLLGTIGGINATSLVLVGFGPALWLIYTVVLPHSSGFASETLRERVTRSVGAAARIGVLSVLTAAWWMAGLRNQGAYGLPILKYTETYQTVANSSSAPEVLRGLGHWYFYGGDQLGAWVQPSVTYTERPWVIGLSFLIPVLALIGLVIVRVRHRVFFASLIVMGTLVAVGAHPFDAPSLLGRVFKAVTGTDTGLALRSTPRAIPLLELGLAVGFGAIAAGIAAAASQRWKDRGSRDLPIASTISVLAVLLLAANLLPLWDGTIVANKLSRPEDIPQYWLDAAAAIDAKGTDTRVLELPGSDFATYRWGNTVDDLLPGLIDRPSLARELIPSGTPQSAALLLALDRRYQEGTGESTALAPLARILGVGDIVLRNDLEWERFNTPRPFRMWNSLLRTPGLAPPLIFGTPSYNERASGPLLDATGLSQPPDQAPTAPVAMFPVDDALPIVRSVTATDPMLMAGDAEGLVDLAAQGLLDPSQAIFFSASFVADTTGLHKIVDDGAVLVVSDTNAKQGLRWGTVRENLGAVERSDESSLTFDPADDRLDVFPGQTTDNQTVAIQRGAKISATAYGNSVSFSPEERPYLAFDGDPTTAWRVGAFDDVIGDRIVADLDTPTTIDHLTLQQPTGNRWITRARITVGDRVFDVDLGDQSFTAPGQTIPFPATTTDKVSIEVTGTNVGNAASFRSYSGVGFNEIGIPGVHVTETLRLPTDLLSTVGSADTSHRLLLMVTRNRVDPTSPTRSDPETSIHREVALPSTRSYSLIGTARLDTHSSAETIRSLLGESGLPMVTASSWLPTDVVDRGRSAFDGDAMTWWTPGVDDTAGSWVQIQSPSPGTTDAVTVTYATDGRHSVPADISVLADGAEVGSVSVPDSPDGPVGSTASIRIPIAPGTNASTWRVRIDTVHPRTSVPWLGGGAQIVPVAIADIAGVPATPAALPTSIDTGCRSDLVSIDGSPASVRIVGSTTAIRAGATLDLVSCDTVSIPAGTATITTTDGRSTGLDVDRLVLGSDPGGSAIGVRVLPGAQGDVTVDASGFQPGVPPSSTKVTVTRSRPDQVDLEVTGLDSSSWLVLGQSYSNGWTASSPELGSLGSPTLIEGYANGWRLDPHSGTVHITLKWGPQGVVWIGILVSLLGVLLCLALLVLPPIRRRRRRSNDDDSDPADDEDTAADEDIDLAPGPLTERAPASGRWRAPVAGAALTVVFGVLTLATAPIPIALALGIAVGLVMRTGRWTRLLGLIAPAALGAAGLYSVAKEWRGHYFNYEWPGVTERVSFLGIVAVTALAGWIIVTAWRDESMNRGETQREGPAAPRDDGPQNPDD
jgi:arabinofuranan 3-O-arabinosyltransferase